METPSRDVEEIRFTRSTLRIACSSGTVMDDSTSLALAPDHVVVTVMRPKVKSGKNCLLSCSSAQTPLVHMIAMLRLAATGWRAKTAMSPLCESVMVPGHGAGASVAPVSTTRTGRPFTAFGSGEITTRSPSLSSSEYTST